MGKIQAHSQLLKAHYCQESFPTTWCPGCGIGTTIGAIVRAIEATGVDKERFVFVTGIGCYGGAGSYLCYSDIHALHGRCPSYATGLKLAKPDVYPILLMGDGDSSSIGGNHLIHAARRNIDLTAIILNNHIYGMTGGQYSPTTPPGTRASTAPFGMVEHAFDLCGLVQGAGATFVARTTVYHVNQMTRFIKRAILHPGFAMVEVESPCPTYFGRLNKRPDPVEMLQWLKDKAVPIEKTGKMSPEELEGRIVTGIFVEENRAEYVNEYYSMVSRQKGRGEREKPGFTPPSERPTVDRKTEVRLSGSGGQGVILAGIILAEAAGIHDGKHVVQTQSYGVEARGGASRAEVIISNEEIVFPEVLKPDILLAMNQASLQKYAGTLKEGGILIVNSDHVQEKLPLDATVFAIPMTQLGRQAGDEMVSNIVALGALASLTGIVSRDSLRGAVLSRVPKGTEKRNSVALDLGFKAAQEAKAGISAGA